MKEQRMKERNESTEPIKVLSRLSSPRPVPREEKETEVVKVSSPRPSSPRPVPREQKEVEKESKLSSPRPSSPRPVPREEKEEKEYEPSSRLSSPRPVPREQKELAKVSSPRPSSPRPVPREQKEVEKGKEVEVETSSIESIRVSSPRNVDKSVKDFVEEEQSRKSQSSQSSGSYSSSYGESQSGQPRHAKFFIPPLPHKERSSSRQEIHDAWETKTNKMKSKPKRISEQQRLYELYKVQKGQRLVKAGEKYYVVKKYEKLTEEEQTLERTDLEVQFRTLNRQWNKQGMHFRMPEKEESLTTMSVRLQQYKRFVMSRLCSDNHRLFLIFSWMMTEGGLCWLGFKASGYTESQLKQFESYQNYLVEIGESGGMKIGEGWSPLTWIAVLSTVNAAVFVGMNSFAGKEGAETASKLVSSMISGQKEPPVDDEGNVIPEDKRTESDPLGDAIGSMTGLGSNPMISMITKMGPGLFSMFTGRTQTAKEKRAERARKRQGPTHT